MHYFVIYDKIKIFVLALVIFFIGTPVTYGDSLVLDIDQVDNIRIGEYVTANVKLDIQQASVNTLFGNLYFDSKIFRIEEVNISSSVVPLWIDRPTISDNNINFSAMFPNGFNGVVTPLNDKAQPGLLFTVVLQAIESGQSKIEFIDTEAMYADAKTVNLEQPSVLLSVDTIKKAKSSPIFDNEKLDAADETPPKSFRPYIYYPDITCDTTPYAAFETIDDFSGISHYEVGIATQERRIASVSFSKQQSPYALSDVNPGSWIVVKAIDNAGNEQVGYTRYVDPESAESSCDPVANFEAGNTLKSLLMVAGILLVAFILWFILKKKRRQ